MQSSFSQAALEARAFRPFADAWLNEERQDLRRHGKPGALTKSVRTMLSRGPRRTRRARPIGRLA